MVESTEVTSTSSESASESGATGSGGASAEVVGPGAGVLAGAGLGAGVAPWPPQPTSASAATSRLRFRWVGIDLPVWMVPGLQAERQMMIPQCIMALPIPQARRRWYLLSVCSTLALSALARGRRFFIVRFDQ